MKNINIRKTVGVVLAFWAMFFVNGAVQADAKTNYDYHLAILNLTSGPVELLFWGASGSDNHWDAATNPVKLFTGSNEAEASASFDPCSAQGGGNDVDQTMGTHARQGLDTSSRYRSSTVRINEKNSAFDKNEGQVVVRTTRFNDFENIKPDYCPSHQYDFLPESFGARSDLFIIVLDKKIDKHFIWAGKTLHVSDNDDGREVWANTTRSIFYTYYYKYACQYFLFNPPDNKDEKGYHKNNDRRSDNDIANDGWYVNSGGGSDDLLWATLAAIGYKELSVKNNNGMNRDVLQIYQRGSDSNSDLCGQFFTPKDLRHIFNYLYLSGYYYAGIYTPDTWYGIPWKDHSRNTDYTDPLEDQRDTRDHSGFHFRASISNGLFWLYAARLLKNSSLFQLTAADIASCRKTIENEYNLFFVEHKDLYICSTGKTSGTQHELNRSGLVEDGAQFPCLAFVDGHTTVPQWEKLKTANKPNDYSTWTYNTGMVLGALGESYLADPTALNATKFLINHGLDLAHAGLDRLAWQKQDSDNAPPGVICEIETEKGGLRISDESIANSILIFKGIYACFMGDFAGALYEALVAGHLTGADKKQAIDCYKRISGVLRGTSNFIWAEWGDSPPEPWVRKTSQYLKENPKKKHSSSISQGSAAGAHLAAGRLAWLDRKLEALGIIDDPDEYLIYSK